MQLVSYRWQGGDRVGLLHAGGVREIAAPAAGPWDMLALIRRVVESQWTPEAATTAVPLAEVRLLAPIPRPARNVWCVGRNYRSHASELAGSVFKTSNAEVATWPIVFTKAPECVV